MSGTTRADRIVIMGMSPWLKEPLSFGTARGLETLVIHYWAIPRDSSYANPILLPRRLLISFSSAVPRARRQYTCLLASIMMSPTFYATFHGDILQSFTAT